MVANIVYRIAKTRPWSAPEDSPLQWVLLRGGTSGTKVLPDTDVAVFTSEAEAELFQGYLESIYREGKK